jgi:putative copper resistance protein D
VALMSLLGLRQSLRANPTAPLTILRSWSFDPIIVLGLFAAAALYLRGIARVRPTPISFPRWRAACFLSGLGVAYLALQSPIHDYSGRLFAVHMVQHLLLTMVAAPLMVLGTPIVLALRASTSSFRTRLLVPLLQSRAATLLSHTVVSWSLFTVALWASHFTNLYEDALGSEGVHGLEHALYVFAAVLFWRPVVGREVGSSRISHPGRLLYLFLAMPQMAFLGLAIYSSDQILYPHYLFTTAALGTSALADQHLAGVLMWTSSMVLMLPAMAFVLFDWMKKDISESARLDTRLDRAASAVRRNENSVPRANPSP